MLWLSCLQAVADFRKQVLTPFFVTYSGGKVNAKAFFEALTTLQVHHICSSEHLSAGNTNRTIVSIIHFRMPYRI